MKYILGVVSGEDSEGSQHGADAGVSIETLDNNGCFGDETTSTSRLLPRVESSMFKGLSFGVSLDLLKKANIDFSFPLSNRILPSLNLTKSGSSLLNFNIFNKFLIFVVS